MPTPTGLILYEGPSEIDGQPIVAVATLSSTNEKTGNMIQTWILRSDVDPVTAARLGHDYSNCGTCGHRPFTVRYTGDTPCYVELARAPLSVFNAFKRGVYPTATTADIVHFFAGRMLRLGSYGEATAAPADTWALPVFLADGHTGYTQRWRKTQVQEYKHILMASVDDPIDAIEARALGWRTFRIMRADDPRPAHANLLPGEFQCPASEEAGKRKQCIECLACDGADPERTSQASPVILEHGTAVRRVIKIRRDLMQARPVAPAAH